MQTVGSGGDGSACACVEAGAALPPLLPPLPPLLGPLELDRLPGPFELDLEFPLEFPFWFPLESPLEFFWMWASGQSLPSLQKPRS